jgi:hypothetical protein
MEALRHPVPLRRRTRFAICGALGAGRGFIGAGLIVLYNNLLDGVLLQGFRNVYSNNLLADLPSGRFLLLVLFIA